MPELSFCNELLAAEGHPLDRQCEIVAALGYMGLELAPGTLAERPHQITDAEAVAIRRRVEAHGLRVTGLHWLLAPYPDLSITEPEAQSRTREVLTRLVELCAILGGRVLVHGSPGQRRPPEGVAASEAEDRLPDFLAPIAAVAERAGVTYCLEPLAETPVVTTVETALRVVDAVASPAFRTMIDTSAAGQAEATPVPDLLASRLSDPRIAHVHLNDTNRGGPGMGSDPFPAIVAAIRNASWPHPIGVEPFRTVIDATATAALAAGTLRASWQAARTSG